jgi:hypothetical protein
VYIILYVLIKRLTTMDILNFISWIKAKRVTTTLPDGSLIAVGAPSTKRDDKYLTVAMTLNDAVQSGNVGNTKHYELDIAVTSTVIVDTPRGIIDILNMGSSAPLTPDPAYATSVSFTIDNLDLDLTLANRDNIYVQYSVYYKNTITDNAIPHLITTGIATGLEFNLYNANPATAGVNNWDGDLYVYYELYTIN